MAEVHDHADAVHFGDHRFAECGQAIVFRLVSAAVGPVIIVVPRQRHVTDARRAIGTQRGHRIADLVPAFGPHQRRDLAALVDADNIGRRHGALEIVRVSADQAVDDVDLFEGRLDRAFAGEARRKIDRPILPADAARAQARHVRHHRRRALVAVCGQPLHRGLVVFAHFPRHIVMTIDQRGAFKDTVDPGLCGGVDLRVCRRSESGEHRSEKHRERAGEGYKGYTMEGC